MITGPLKWYTVANTLVQTVNGALTATPARACVVPGQVVWEECCSGLLAATVAHTFFTDSFPQPQSQPIGNCNPASEAAEIVLTILRCVPVPGGTAPPPCSDLDTTSQLLARDGQEALEALLTQLCTMKNAQPYQILDFLMGDMLIQGPEGGCVGNEVHIMVELPRG